MSKKKAEVIDFLKARSKRIVEGPEEPESHEEEGAFVQCPHCSGIEWAVILDEDNHQVTHLVCISEECDGDSWGEVENGIVSEEIYHYDP